MRRVATLFLLATGLVTSTSTARAQDLLECLVPGIQDFRAGPAHLDQADIVSGQILLRGAGHGPHAADYEFQPL